jgi:tetratricopeptide (TPR) repeat protein
LLPDVGGAELPVALSQDPDIARFQLFDSVTALVKHAAQLQPLMVVLDDLQVADTASLLLLQFVAGVVGDERILLVATYRDTDPALRDPLAETVADLMRSRAVSRVSLRGIAEADAPRFIEAATGVEPPAALAQAVHHETEGNPLFLMEVSRVLLDEGKLGADAGEAARVPVPRSVRDVIERRVRPFSDESLHVLRLASVLGREFGIDALAALTALPESAVLELLQRPMEEQILVELPDNRTRMRFGHVIIRECLYEGIPRAQRREFHRKALATLETSYGGHSQPHLSELAHHAYEGAIAGDEDKVIAYAQRAGDQALSLLAYEEAARLYRLALDSIDQSPNGDPTRRCEILLGLGDALTRAGDEAAAKSIFLLAAACARAIDRNDHLARAALGYAARHAWGRAAGDKQLIPLLESGVDAVGEHDSVLRARLLARLAGALRDRLQREPRETYAQEAVAVARRLNDPSALAYALDGFFGATWRPDNPLSERMAVADEIVRIGEAAGDPEIELWGHVDRTVTFIELGDLRSAGDEVRAVQGTGGELRQPELRWLGAGMAAVLALVRGQFDDAEALVETALESGQRSRPGDALPTYAGQMFQLRREQGRLDEIEDLVERAAQEYEWYPFFRCARAIIDVECGRQLRARAELDALGADAFARLPFDNYWVTNMSLLGEVAHLLGDVDAAAAIYEQLVPYSSRNAYAPPEGCTGSVSRVLGLLARTLARPDDAARHFEDALTQNERMGARPWVARTQYAFGSMLGDSDDAAQRARGNALLRDAMRTCNELNMPALREKVAAELAPASATAPAKAQEAPAKTNRFALEGEYWAITFADETVRLRDSKGMRILSVLLASPGRPQPSLDLERIGESGDAATVRAVASSDAGDVLDDEARRQYRARIADLRLSIDDAASNGQSDRAGALQEELDFITHELSRGMGLGGRSRRAGSAAERARINVTRAVKTAMQRIADGSPALAAHLEATVRTGSACVYVPDPRAPIEWSVSPS